MGGFRRGIGNTKAKTKLDVGNMNVTNVARLGVHFFCLFCSSGIEVSEENRRGRSCAV